MLFVSFRSVNYGFSHHQRPGLSVELYLSRTLLLDSAHGKFDIRHWFRSWNVSCVESNARIHYINYILPRILRVSCTRHAQQSCVQSWLLSESVVGWKCGKACFQEKKLESDMNDKKKAKYDEVNVSTFRKQTNKKGNQEQRYQSTKKRHLALTFLRWHIQ